MLATLGAVFLTSSVSYSCEIVALKNCLEHIHILLSLFHKSNDYVPVLDGLPMCYLFYFNIASCLSWVPEQGTVGASGDLAPLSHLALGLMGEGQMWSPQTGWGEAKYVLETHNLTPIRLGAKEGLARINGTQLITSIGAEAVERAGNIAKQADVVASLTLEVLKGTSRAFDSGKILIYTN